MRAVESFGASVVGIELSETLAQKSESSTVVAQLPGISVKSNTPDGAYAVLVVEHLADHEALFLETARVIGSGEVLALAANHPVWTAPDSSPITDTDTEILWRSGEYFSSGTVDVAAGEGLSLSTTAT